MIFKKNLVFLGMMGSGKSSIGYLVSKKLNLKFIDIDNLITKESKMSVLNLFNEKGESYFRNIEEKITLKTLKMSGNVVSLGGGSFINEKIRKKVLDYNFSFWLDWTESILLKRIKSNKERPLALRLSDQEIKQLIRKRSKVYSKAEFKINCNNLTKTEIVKKIIKIYELN
jgi:shikimate kinase